MNLLQYRPNFINLSQQHQHGFRWNGSNSLLAANATESSQSTHGVNSQDNNWLNSTHGLSADQLQQIARALSMMTSNHTNGNSNAYANAACMSLFSNASINSVFTKHWILEFG